MATELTTTRNRYDDGSEVRVRFDRSGNPKGALICIPDPARLRDGDPTAYVIIECGVLMADRERARREAAERAARPEIVAGELVVVDGITYRVDPVLGRYSPSSLTPVVDDQPGPDDCGGCDNGCCGEENGSGVCCGACDTGA